MCLLQTAAQLLAAHKNLRFRPSSALLEALAVHVETDACLGAPRSLAVIIWGLGGLDHRPSNLGAYQQVSRGSWVWGWQIACCLCGICRSYPAQRHLQTVPCQTLSRQAQILLQSTCCSTDLQPPEGSSQPAAGSDGRASSWIATRQSCPSPAPLKCWPLLSPKVQHQQQSTSDVCR